MHYVISGPPTPPNTPLGLGLSARGQRPLTLFNKIGTLFETRRCLHQFLQERPSFGARVPRDLLEVVRTEFRSRLGLEPDGVYILPGFWKFKDLAFRFQVSGFRLQVPGFRFQVSCFKDSQASGEPLEASGSV